MDIGHPGGPQDTQSADGFGWNAVFTEDNTVVVESLNFVLSPDNHLYVIAIQSPGDNGFQQVSVLDQFHQPEHFIALGKFRLGKHKV